ncbi:MAG: glutamine synthetase family protein [Streptosporangiales bacterium]|nr:glutamine synthetase family protein [Streptosporangiales bacterium]
MTVDVARLQNTGVAGVTIAWADNSGIPRSRTVPAAAFGDAVRHGVGITPLFAVFDSHDGITFAHDGLPNPSGDIRLIPDSDRVTPLAGQPAFAWVPGRQAGPDGAPWPYDQRTRLEAQVARAAAAGLSVRAGFELEFFVSLSDDGPLGAHDGPAYSPHALLQVDDFAADVLRGLAANGVPAGQFHAEYGPSQLEVSLAPADPVTAADRQLLARQTIHAAARAHGLRVSFAPLVTADGVGNGLHLHVSVSRGSENLLADAGKGVPEGQGASFLGGLVRDLPGIAGVSAPSVPSLLRRRPGYFAGAYRFWGVENREAPLRYVPSSPFLGAGRANVELKASDASGNPYLALAAVLSAGLAGIDDGAPLPPPVQDDPGTWTDAQRTEKGIALLPSTPEEAERALLASPAVAAALGEPLLGAFTAVRRSDAAWAADHTPEETVAAHRWLY